MRWLLTFEDLEDTNLKVWQREDARRRLLADDDVRAVGHPGVMPDDDRRNTEQLVDELTATLEERGLKSIRLPNVQMQAADVPEAYVIYRFESQIGIHPTVWAAEHLFSVRDDGSYQLHATAPGREEQSEVETYGSCAYQLLMILATIDGVLTEPMVDPARLDAIRVELERPLGPWPPLRLVEVDTAAGAGRRDTRRPASSVTERAADRAYGSRGAATPSRRAQVRPSCRR